MTYLPDSPRHAILLLAAIATSVGCGNGQHSIAITVVSDLRPGSEVTEIRTNLVRGVVVVETSLVTLSEGDDLSSDFLVADFVDVPAGDYLVEVIGRGPNGSVSTRGYVSLYSDIVHPLILNGDCVAAICPRPGDALDATECAMGACEAPTCIGDCPADPAGPGEGAAGPTPTMYPCPGIVDRFDANGVGVGAAVALAEVAHPNPEAVVLVRSDHPDNVGGVSQGATLGVLLARHLDAPLILNPGGSIHSRVADYLSAEMPRDVYVVGGPSTVSDRVLSQIAAIGPRVTRVASGGRAPTAEAIAMEVRSPDGRAVIASGGGGHVRNLVIAASAAAVSGRPLLFAYSYGVPEETSRALAALGITGLDVVADEAAIPDSVLDTLGIPYERYTASDPYAIATSVASGIAPAAPEAALVPLGSPLLALPAGALGLPILFVDDASLPSVTADYVRTSSIGAVRLMGPTGEPEAIERAACGILLSP